MISKLFLSGTALVGGVLFAATADEPTRPQQPQRVKTTSIPEAKPAALAAEAQTLEEKEPESAEPAERRVSPDEDAIRLVDDSFVRAYEAGDAKAVAEHFTKDAEYVDETGTVFEGREAIEASMKDFFAESPVCKLQINTDSIRTISAGVVVQDGSTLISRGEETAPCECQYTTVYAKVDGKWLIASVRDRAPRDLREHSVHLQQLGWLKGDWIDEGDDSIVNFSCEAVDSGNFLMRKFTIVIGGEEAMSGTQRIGWDPLTGKLRTWIFDSEGAYGEGLWHHDQENDRWVLKTTGVTADGETASSTSLYTFVNEHTMTWQSVDHEIAGIQQPDSDIITIVRHSAGPAPAIAADLNAPAER
jgi:uncharacterized protein (TIGR02246 family)